MTKSIGYIALLWFIIAFMSACLSHPMKRIQSWPNNLLSNDSCIILEDRLERLIVLFNNGLVFFGNREIIENHSLFTKNDSYNCRYCWGRNQYQNDMLTIFQPIPVGYLNIPRSFQVKELIYKVNKDTITSLIKPYDKIDIRKTTLSIDPNQAWLATK